MIGQTIFYAWVVVMLLIGVSTVMMNLESLLGKLLILLPIIAMILMYFGI